MIKLKKAHDISKAEKRKKSSNKKAELEHKKDAFQKNGFYIIILLMKNFMIKLKR